MPTGVNLSNLLLGVEAPSSRKPKARDGKRRGSRERLKFPRGLCFMKLEIGIVQKVRNEPCHITSRTISYNI
jgi:hypothetical protein